MNGEESLALMVQVTWSSCPKASSSAIVIRIQHDNLRRTSRTHKKQRVHSRIPALKKINIRRLCLLAAASLKPYKWLQFDRATIALKQTQHAG